MEDTFDVLFLDNFIRFTNKKIAEVRQLSQNKLADHRDKLKTELNMSFGHQLTSYVKTVPMWDGFGYKENEIVPFEISKKFGDLDIAPKYIAHGNIIIGTIVKDHTTIDTFRLYYLVTELFGKNLLEMYNIDFKPATLPFEWTELMKNLRKALNGDNFPFCTLAFDYFFPESIPENIRNEVKIVYQKMFQLGYEHPDPNATNFLVNEQGIVKVIDFDESY